MAHFTLDSDIASFDTAAFRNSLLSRFPAAYDAVLTVAPASIVVAAQLVMPSAFAASAAATTIANTPVSIVSDWFVGVTIIDVPLVQATEAL